MRDQKLYNRISDYVNMVIDQAFNVIGKPNDAKTTIIIVGNNTEDVVCLVLMKSRAHLQVYNRVAYRLANNFKKNFGLDIKFFPAIKGYWESSATHDLKDNGKYGILLYTTSKRSTLDTIIDPNHSVLYFNTIHGEFSMSLFPWEDDTKFKDSRYDGYHPDICKTRVLYLDIIKHKGVEGISYYGKEGWDEYVQDYMAVCNGQRPDHGVTYTIIYDGKKLV